MRVNSGNKSSDSSLYTKKELIAWIFDVTNNKVQNIEQLSNGVVFCQLLDAISDGKVRKQKINLSAKLQHQNLVNLKILSTSMLAAGIDKKFDAQRISQRKTQDILQLLQWFRKHFLVNSNHNLTMRNPKGSLNGQIKLPAQAFSQEHQQKTSINWSSSKKEPLDIISKEDLQHCFIVNKQIRKVLTSEVGSGSAEKKLELIKSILFGCKQPKQVENKKEKHEEQNLNSTAAPITQANEVKLEDYQSSMNEIRVIMKDPSAAQAWGNTLAQ